MNSPLLIHIPKTGGRTIVYHTGVKRHSHNTRNEKFKYPGDANLSKYDYIFAIIRNPLDRVVSAYHYLNLGGNNPQDEEDRFKYLSPYASFDEFIRRGLVTAKDDQMHFIPQSEFVRDVDCELFPFENIKQVVKDLCKKFKVEVPDKIVKGNSSDHGYFDDYYNEETRKIVETLYEKDFELWKSIRR